MPTPSAITGSVATFTPMPSATISASARIEVSISGSTAHDHRAPGAEGDEAQQHHRAVDQQQHLRQASLTTMLVAASMPALPAASRNFTSARVVGRRRRPRRGRPRASASRPCGRAGRRRRVSRLQASLYRPRGAPAVTVLSMSWLGRNSYHFGLPSFRPASTRRFSSASVLVLSTPSSWRSCHSSASILFSVVVLRALAVGRLHHHREHVARGAVGRVDEGDVAVVAAVGTQLGRTGVEVADRQLRADARSRRRPAPARRRRPMAARAAA